MHVTYVFDGCFEIGIKNNNFDSLLLTQHHSEVQKVNVAMAYEIFL